MPQQLMVRNMTKNTGSSTPSPNVSSSPIVPQNGVKTVGGVLDIENALKEIKTDDYIKVMQAGDPSLSAYIGGLDQEIAKVRRRIVIMPIKESLQRDDAQRVIDVLVENGVRQPRDIKGKDNNIIGIEVFVDDMKKVARIADKPIGNHSVQL